MVTERLDIKDEALYWDNIKKTAHALIAGKLVAFPTETVYGLGVNADDNVAIGSLYSVKQRPGNKQLAIMIADPEDVTKYVKEVPTIAKVLIDSFWPGPLTIVFMLHHDKSIGIRNSSNHVVRDLARTANVAIASTSANITGKQPAIDAQQVINSFGDNIDVVLDGGPAHSRTPSTVVRVKDDKLEILRYGIIKEERIKRCLNENSVSVRS